MDSVIIIQILKLSDNDYQQYAKMEKVGNVKEQIGKVSRNIFPERKKNILKI